MRFVLKSMVVKIKPGRVRGSNGQMENQLVVQSKRTQSFKDQKFHCVLRGHRTVICCYYKKIYIQI